MADIINLRRARKGIERAHRQVAAAENRVRFGRTSAERAEISAETTRASDVLDAHYLSSKGPAAKDTPSGNDG